MHVLPTTTLSMYSKRIAFQAIVVAHLNVC